MVHGLRRPTCWVRLKRSASMWTTAASMCDAVPEPGELVVDGGVAPMTRASAACAALTGWRLATARATAPAAAAFFASARPPLLAAMVVVWVNVRPLVGGWAARSM
ncbi:hypothetical protein SGLAM104S_04917 [Streptomyces glaucescens]